MIKSNQTLSKILWSRVLENSNNNIRYDTINSSNTPSIFMRITKKSFCTIDEKKTNYYKPKQPLIFNNGLLPLINVKNSKILNNFDKQKIRINVLLAATCFYIIYQIFNLKNKKKDKKLIEIKNISIPLAIVFLIYNLKKRGIMNNKLRRLVRELSLTEDGHNLEIKTWTNRKFKVNINEIAKVRQAEFIIFTIEYPELMDKVYPFQIIRGEFQGYLFVPKDIETNKELINAVMLGSYIDIKNSIGSTGTVIIEAGNK